jgi:hypothetical protein
MTNSIMSATTRNSANKISFIKRVGADGGSFSVTVPFVIKDSFKSAFPSAKWDRFTKTWICGPRSEKRLTAFAEGTLRAVSAAAKAQEALEEAEFLEGELEKASAEIEAIAREIAKKTEQIRSREEVKDAINEAMGKIAQLKAEKAALDSSSDAEIGELTEKVRGIIDFEVIDGCRSSMISLASRTPKKSHLREDYEKCIEELCEQREALEAAGLRSRALNRLCGLNYNRASRGDRDDPSRFSSSEESIIDTIEKIEDSE